MFKKLTVLAMAVGAVAALALPASASASWKHHSTPISENKTLGLTGTAEFFSHSLNGGVRCQITSQVDFEPGTTGNITTFNPHPTSDTTNCVGLGNLSPCQIHNQTPTGLSPHGTGWVIHTTSDAVGPTIQITHGDIHSQATGFFCFAQQLTITAGTVTAIPTNTQNVRQTGNTVGRVTLQGTVNVHTSAGTDEAATVHGILDVEGNDYGTYSL